MERKWIFCSIGLFIFFMIISSHTIYAESCESVTDLQMPEDPVSLYAWDDTSSYFNFKFLNATGDIENNINYSGWCIQKDKVMNRPNIKHEVTLFLSYNFDTMPSYFANIPNSTETWHKINFLINNRDGIHKNIVQNIIWNFTCDEPLSSAAQNYSEEIDLINQTTFCPEIGQYVVILVNTSEEAGVQHAIFELLLTSDDSPTDDDDDTNTGRQSGGSTGGGNRPPTADGSKNAPFQASVEEPIIFDASKSYDYDGRIIEWNWSFGDGNYVLGEIVDYSYSSAGTYTVTLKVTDNDGSTDTYTTIAEIVQPNRPPDQPIITGDTDCELQTTYSYTLMANDLDNDTLRFTIDWGDGSTSETTDYYQNNTERSIDHTWTSSGIYTLKVFAEDPSGSPSDTAQKTIFVDVTVYYIDDEIKGYFIDYGKDGTIESFHDNQTKKTITVEQGDNNWYLLDYNEDGIIDYQYHITDGLQPYVYPADTADSSWLTDNILYIIVIGLLGIVALIFIFFKIEIK